MELFLKFFFFYSDLISVLNFVGSVLLDWKTAVIIICVLFDSMDLDLKHESKKMIMFQKMMPSKPLNLLLSPFPIMSTISRLSL